MPALHPGDYLVRALRSHYSQARTSPCAVLAPRQTPYFIPAWAQRSTSAIGTFVRKFADTLNIYAGARVALSSPLSRDGDAQQRLWNATLRLLRVTRPSELLLSPPDLLASEPFLHAGEG